MRNKNLMEGQWGPILKKLDSSTLETSKNHLIRSFLRNGRMRVKNKRFAQIQWILSNVFDIGNRC